MAVPAQVLVVADGDVDRSLLRTLGGAVGTMLIAADGGARQVIDEDLVPDLVVGDLDSLPAAERSRLEAMGVELQVAAPDKDESDMELCLLAALASGTRRLVVLGALGLVRPEHSVANLLLLADPRLDGLEVTLAGRGSRITRAGTAGGPGALEIAGEPGDLVSILPLGDAVEGVTTHGLRFPLADETLPLGPSRGLSNELLEPTAYVTSRRGRLLIIHTRRSMADAPATGGT